MEAELDRPIFVYDGDCAFCSRCVEKLRARTGSALEYLPYQEAEDRFEGLSSEDFEKSVYLISEQGDDVCRGGEAILRARTFGGDPRSFPYELYRRSPFFARVVECAYRWVSNHRQGVSRLVTALWGRAKESSTYARSSWLFGRLLGGVALVAFLSYWSQADGLIGAEGIMPYEEDLERVEVFAQASETSPGPIQIRPTLLWMKEWIGPDLLFGVGSLCGLMLLFGFWAGPACLGAWACYLSLMVAGEPFLSFQWDSLLLETCLLSLFFLPWKPLDRLRDNRFPKTFARLLLVGLLFKLMFESGVVKFTYFAPDGSNAWSEENALDYHFWTQPAPNGASWFFHHLPGGLHTFFLWNMYFCEIALPFLFFMPRNLRHISFFGQVVLQVAILLSGNYGYFNLLTLVLCTLLVDDQLLPACLRPEGEAKVPAKRRRAWRRLSSAALGLTCGLFAWSLVHYLKADFRGNRAEDADLNEDRPAEWERELARALGLTRSMNSYGLFRVMTKTRPELLVEASMDGEDWRPYAFKWKPGELERRPGFFIGHMPRLDWQLWFEALNAERYAGNDFSKFLYQRFAQVIGEGGERKDLFRVDEILSSADLAALSRMSVEQRRGVLHKYEAHLNAFLGNSAWFAQFLARLAEAEPAVLNLLEKAPFGGVPPKYLRVTLWQYRFASPERKEKGYWWERVRTDGFEIVIEKRRRGSEP